MESKLKNLEEQIRQYKLNKIHVVESKISEYERVFNTIKENALFRYTKNATSVILIIIFLLLTGVSMIFGLALFFPEQIIELTGSGQEWTPQERDEFISESNYFAFFFIILSLLFGSITLLLKKNMRKKNTIFRLSRLLQDVIEYMDENVKEDKKKYEYFVDSMSEIEKEPKTDDDSLGQSHPNLA